jgi:peptidoglycan hydrolase CwlO-like protein
MTLNELKSKGDLDPSVLSHRILIKRTDRPDEWSMDELARKALELENQNKDLLKKFYYVSKELEESKKENETLEAEVKRLESYLIVMHGEINSHRRDKKIELLNRIWEKGEWK